MPDQFDKTSIPNFVKEVLVSVVESRLSAAESDMVHRVLWTAMCRTDMLERSYRYLTEDAAGGMEEGLRNQVAVLFGSKDWVE